MRFVSPVLKRVVYPGLARAGYFRHSATEGPAILTYHGVLPAGYHVLDPDMDGSLVAAECFRRQLRLLKSSYHPITPRQFLHWVDSGEPLPARSVLLTCDDGLQNTVTDMLPVLQDADLSCLFFITGASLADSASVLWYEELYLMFLVASEEITLNLPGLAADPRAQGRRQKRSLWSKLVAALSQTTADRRGELLIEIQRQLNLPAGWRNSYLKGPAADRRFQLLTCNGVRQLISAGMTIGAHTLSHPALSRLASEAAWDEIANSRLALEKEFGQPVWALAYPFGDPDSVGQREIAMAERAGFRCAFLNVGGGFGASLPHFAIPRVHVTAEMSLAEFEAHLSGFYQNLRRRILKQHHQAAVGLQRGAAL